MLKRIFWISDERRLAMLWRLVVQTVIAIVLILVLSIPIFVGSILTGNPPEAGNAEAAPLWVQNVLFAIQALGIFLSVYIAGRFIDRRKFADFGLHFNRDWWRDLGFGLALGVVLMALIFAVELAAGWIVVTGAFVVPDSQSGLSFPIAILVPAAIFLMVGIYEELFSRGYHLKNMAEGFAALPFLGPAGAILVGTFVSSAVFGVLHAGNPNATLISTVNIFFAGFLLASGYLLTGELAIPIGLHITWNFFQGNVFGFPVSGTDAGATFISIEQSGDPLITGGAFGPEAGLIGIAAMLLGIVLTVGWVRWRRGEVKLQKRLVVADFNYARAEEVTGT